ncbi:DUF4238 domain-containing protein [Methylophilus sp. Q8]|uniref:DUF4238 domain-containing protein n=1 Tax=Methylophilus sp. Q8 TaxID=1506586 RepID=UPI0009DCADE9|nr:DUF4238 domain-containing protein [Methylophilus sp. Q8]
MSAVRHHFVPQGFLRGFTINGDNSRSFVWVYDKRAGHAPRMKSVRSIAWAPAYYAQERDDGSTDLDTIETGLAKTIDNEIPLILQKITPTVGQCVELAAEDKAALAFFVGLSLTRVPSFRDGINAMYSRVAQAALSYQLDRDSRLGELAEKYGVTAEAKPWVSLRPMIEMAQSIASSALTKNWQFFVAPPSVPLVTSDNPVVFSGEAVGLSQLGPAHPGAELVMNLRKDMAVVFTPKTGYPTMRTFSLSPIEARKFNRGIVRAARHRVFADHQSETLDEFVKKYANDEQRIVV